MKLKKAMIAAALAASVLFTSTSASYTALAAPRETAQELANYKLAITTRINEIEQALASNLSYQVGALRELRYVSEYLMYFQHAARNAEDLGFSSQELDYYGKRILAYVDSFNGKYADESDKYEPVQLSFGDTSLSIDERYANLMSYSVTALQDTIVSYYDTVATKCDRNMPSADPDKTEYLRKNSLIAEYLYKGLLIYQDVPITLNNIMPTAENGDRVKYSVDGSGSNDSMNNRVANIVSSHEELLQYGKKVSQKSNNNSLDVDLEDTALEMFTNIELDEDGNYVYPDEVQLSQPYLALLAGSSVYTPFQSYTGSSEFTNAVSALADNDVQAQTLIQAYNKYKDLRKPLYKRNISSNGDITGTADLLTIQDFLDDVESGASGALVTLQGDFHHNNTASAWIYSQNELTYNYSNSENASDVINVSAESNTQYDTSNWISTVESCAQAMTDYMNEKIAQNPNYDKTYSGASEDKITITIQGKSYTIFPCCTGLVNLALCVNGNVDSNNSDKLSLASQYKNSAYQSMANNIEFIPVSGNITSLNDVKAGDIVIKTGHVQIITKVEGNTVTFRSWGRSTSYQTAGEYTSTISVTNDAIVIDGKPYDYVWRIKGRGTQASDIDTSGVVRAFANERSYVQRDINDIDITSSQTLVNTMKDTIFVGDSRTEGLYNAFIDKGATPQSLADNHVYFVHRVGEGYNWFVNTGINEVNNVLHENPIVNFNIIVNLGVNDLLNADKYSAKLNELASGEGAWANANVFFESVGAVKEDKARENGYNVTNNDIAAFNSGIKTSLAQAVAYLDVTSDMLTSNNDLNIGYVTSDGLHYTNATSLKLCQKTIEAIRGTNSTTNIDHSELTTEATSATEEATTEAEDTELVEDDLENALYAYDTITDENYMTQPVLFYGTRYQRNIDNTTTALLQNIISNTSDLNSVSNMDSRYLYLNMFGDIVTDDNLVILPGVANPAIYKASKNYNPYTVAFMNSYPVITNRGLYFQVSAEKDIGKYVLMSQATGEHVSDVALNWCMITSNSDIASTNMLRAKSVSSIFYTNITDENEILTGQRCVFNSVETWAASNLYNYNVVLQTYNPSLDEQLLFPYDYVTDKDFKVASTIVKNAYQFIGYNLDEFSYGNNNSLNDNYLAHNVIMSCEDGIKNPQTYYNDKMSEYKQFLATKTEQWTEQVTKASKGIIDKLSNVTGTLGMESSYEDTILGTVLRIMRENFVLIAILVVLILLVAFLKFHRDLLEVCILSAGTVGFFALMVFIIPIYLPMLYNFLVDKTSSTTAYKVLALQAEENTVNDKSIIEIDSDGNYVYNTSSLTLFKVDIKDLNRFYDNMSVSAEDVTAGKTVILNQEAGIFMEGDSIKINTDILFDTLPITGSYKPSQGSICWQLEANKTVSNNLDYYVPYYYFVDNFIGKINTLARIYDLPRSTTSYANHETYDNYLVYSYVNSPVFLTPGNYSLIEQEEAKQYMDNYDDFIAESAEMQSNLESLFGTNTDWLGIADVFMNLSEADKSSLWAETMQANGYYDEHWNPNKDKINRLIEYINKQTKDFVFDMDDAIGSISDDTMIKLIALRAITAFTQEVSQFKHWLYPFSVDYSELSLNSVVKATFVDDYTKYNTMDMDIAEYVADRHGWFVLILFDLLVIVMFIVTNLVNIMIPVLYLLLMLVLFIRFVTVGDVKIPMKGYLKISGSLFIMYTIYNLTFYFIEKLNGSAWGIIVALLITIFVLFVILHTLFAVVLNVLEFGNTVMDARITAIGDKLKIGDIFNKIKFNNAVFTGKNKPAVINRSAQNSRYSFNSSVDSVYERRRRS